MAIYVLTSFRYSWDCLIDWGNAMKVTPFLLEKDKFFKQIYSFIISLMDTSL